jgi:hypothetical protein
MTAKRFGHSPSRTATQPRRHRAVVEPLEDRQLLAALLALTSSNDLLQFDSVTPATITRSTPLTGLQAGETALGLDFRPATGQLYVLGSTSRLYVVNPTTGVATSVGAAPFGTALSGAAFGVDFNPVPDRLRIVSDTGQDLRINPNNGVDTVDTALAFAAGDPNAAADPNVVGSAYSNNVAGTSTTTLYGIDSNRDALVLQGSVGGTPTSPNTGQLTTVGPLGFDTTDQVGFDISGVEGSDLGTAFASLTAPGATTSRLFTVNLTTGAATSLGSIGGGRTVRDITVVPRVETIFAVTASNNLVSFRSDTPQVILGSTPIIGLQLGETILGVDFRPAGGQLYVLGSTSRLYVINTTTGVATAVGTGPFAPTLSGAAFGVDFNPVPDRLRVVSDADQNLRLNPETGVVAGTDTTLAYAVGDSNAGTDPNVVAEAYSNNVAGATTTTLYGIDSGLDILVTQGSAGGSPTSPNTGQLTTVGPLGIDASDVAGFDIGASRNVAYAALSAPGDTTSRLYVINLATGAATLVGPIGVTELVQGIAIASSGSLQFGASSVSANEGGTATITVTRTGGTSGIAQVNFTTGGGTATAGADYTATSGVLVFADGEASKTITVPIATDALVEGNETFIITLSNPTGGATLGTPATATATILDSGDTTGPTITDLRAIGVRGTVAGFVLSFGEDLVPLRAQDATNYVVTTPGRDGFFGNADDRRVALRSVVYDTTARTVTLMTARRIPLGQFVRLVVNATPPQGVADLAGNALDGDANGTPGDAYDVTFARGSSLRYGDGDGDLVSLALQRGGVLELIRGANGEAQQVRVVGARSGRSRLTGRVRPRAGDGRTTIGSLRGTSGVDVRLTDPPFAVGSISATAVDVALDLLGRRPRAGVRS